MLQSHSTIVRSHEHCSLTIIRPYKLQHQTRTVQLIAARSIQVWLLQWREEGIFLFRDITPARTGAPAIRNCVLPFLCAFAKLISDSDGGLKKSCHKAGACSKPPHTQLSRLVTILGYWSMGQGKYSSSLLHSVESHFSFHSNTSTDHAKFSVITVYNNFSYICSVPKSHTT